MQDGASIRELVIEEFRVKLHTKKSPLVMFHGLDLAGVVGGGAPEVGRELLHFITMGVPDSDSLRKTFEDSGLIYLDGNETTLALCALITFPWFQPLHQTNLRSTGQRNLLVSSANAKNRLGSLADDFENPGKQFRRVALPGVALTAQNNVGGSQRLHAVK